jgi:murein DD-endopeptidase MepM/ murein hydrolase activator NlpD
MNKKLLGFIRIFIYSIVLLMVIADIFYIPYLHRKLNNIKILGVESGSPVVLSPHSFKKETILLTSDFVDHFSKYKSPFNDGLTFNELIKKYIRNRWADHYGCMRGTREKKRVHEGIDLYVPENTPVYPLANFGIITEVSDNPFYMVKVKYTKPDGTIDSMKIEYGKTVRILYPEGIESVYTHLNDVFVTLGQEVNGDTKVGITGLTGNIRNSGKPSHLHMELRDEVNRSFDPRNRLRFKQGSISYFLKHLKIVNK